MYGEIVLADDVEFLPLAEQPPEIRDAVPHAEGDVAVSRPRSREASRVVDRESLDLLMQFKAPSRIVDAVLRFAESRGADPEATLEGAYDLLDRLYRARILVPAAKLEEARGERLEEGAQISGYTLGPRVHELEDTDVFFARDDEGRAAAVKVVRAGVARVEREADATRRAGPRAPEVLGVHAWNGHGVLVSEWVFGEDVASAGAALRGRRGAKTEAGLLALVCDVADAFAEIHRAGVLHGDVHPRNVLVEKDGRVRLIDFGLAVDAANASPGMRGGVPFYFEPELATASLDGRSAPATAAGEQYALGALVYFLWTGVHYVDWSLERDAMLRQIVEAEPASFARRRVAEWPALEAIVRRALAKDPAARFGSCADIAEALRALMPEARARDAASPQRRAGERDPGAALARAFFERCGIGGSVQRGRPLDPPYASINYGAAGIAYAIYKLSIAREDAHLLATANVWAEKALVLSSGDEAFHTTRIEINEATVGNASLFHSMIGVHAVRALVALASGESGAAARAVSEFVEASRTPSDFVDLALGKAGVLVGCAALLEAMSDAAACDPAPVVARGVELAGELARLADGAVFGASTETTYLGMAHGWAGLLFALLRWAQARGESAERLRAKLDELASLHEPHGAGLRWPVSNRTVVRRSYVDGWCNGAAGHALLWALAHELLGDAEYGVFAERAAISAWSSTTTLGTICCGLAGIGYACAAAHRVTGDAAWLARARHAARRACGDASKWFYRDSLYKGAVGAVLLREELEASRASAPLLER